MTNSWQSITSAYTYEYGGNPYAPNSCIVTNKPHYMKPQWFHVMPDSSIVIENEHENGFNQYNLKLINDNTSYGAMPMIKGDYWCNNKAVVTWIDSIDDNYKRSKLINQITALIVEHDFVGIEIDFEPTTVDTFRADGITLITNQDIENKFVFLTDLSKAVHKINPKLLKNGSGQSRKVSVAIGATNATTVDNGYQLVDYTKLASTGVDYIMVMNYDWWYSEDIYDNTSLGNRSSSPTKEFEDTIKWALKTIPIDKIVMGIPDYGSNKIIGKDIVEQDIIRYQQASKLPNFKTGLYVKGQIQYNKDVYRGGGELWFNTGTSVVNIPTSVTMNTKREMCEKYGIKQISMWAFASSAACPTPWFSGKTELVL